MVKKTPKAAPRWQPLPEDASTMQVLIVPEVDEYKFNPEEMTKEELKNLAVFIDQSNKTLEVENMVIERYLNRMDANALEKMSQILEAAAIAVQKTERTVNLGGGPSNLSLSKDMGSRITDDSSDETSKSGTTFSDSNRAVKLGILGFSDRGPKVQFAQKIEIVNREIDELKNILETFREKSRKSNYLLRCRNEELTERLKEISDAQNFFENKFLVEGVDRITGRLPGEKFLRYLEMRLKSEEMEIDKMRIRTGSLKIQLNKLLHQLARKEELGETLHAVDFEQLQIENRECQVILDMKTAQVHKIKSVNGNYGTTLNTHTKKLMQQKKILVELNQLVKVKDQFIKKFVVDEKKVNSEVDVIARRLNNISKLMKTYTVPDVMDYIKKKAEVNDMRKEIKVRLRKMNIEELVLAAQAQKLKNFGSHSMSKSLLPGYSTSRLFF